MLKAVIVDDEVSMREALRSLLNIFHSDVSILAEASSVDEAFEAIIKHSPDIVFLDVEIIGGTAFDLLSKFSAPGFKIVFITAHNEYAIRAFKFSASDYLLKPVDPQELNLSVQRVKESINRQADALSIKVLMNNLQGPPGGPKRILLKDYESIHLVELNEIVRCEAEGNYTRFFLADGRILLISKTLKEFDQLFMQGQFFRAHQSHLINLNFFLKYNKGEGGSITMKDGSTLPVAVRKKDLLLDALSRIAD